MHDKHYMLIQKWDEDLMYRTKDTSWMKTCSEFRIHDISAEFFSLYISIFSKRQTKLNVFASKKVKPHLPINYLKLYLQLTATGVSGAIGVIAQRLVELEKRFEIVNVTVQLPCSEE